MASSVSSQTQLMFDLRPGDCLPLADLFDGAAHFPRLGECQGVVGVVGKAWLRQDGDHAAGDLSRLLAEAAQIGRFTLEQNQAGGSKLPESDREDMEVFLARIRQLLPVLGSDILAPIAQPAATAQPGGVLFCRVKGAEARGQRTANGFVVFRGSSAVLERRPSAENYPYLVAQRKQLIADGTLVEKGGFLVFTKDAEFSSPSAAAVVVHGGSANGLIVWKTKDGESLKQLDEQA